MTDDRLTGYATENVVELTDEDRTLLDEVRRAVHVHDGYGWRACRDCRRVEAERVSERFPKPLASKVYEGDTQ